MKEQFDKETKTIKLIGSIYMNPNSTFSPFGWIEVESTNERFWSTSPSYVFVAPYTIEIEMPEGFDPTKEVLNCLQLERKLILASKEQELNRVDAKIQQLLAIEHKPDITTPFD